MTPFMVNFLPWRRQRLVRRTRYWCLLLFCHTGCVLLAITASKQVASRQRLAQETALVVVSQQHQDGVTQLHEVQQIMALLQQQQAGRQASAQTRTDMLRVRQLLEQLSALVPAGLWLTALADQEQGISITGLSHDYANIVQFTTQLESLSLLTAVRLVQARQESPLALSAGEPAALFFQLQADWRDNATLVAQHE